MLLIDETKLTCGVIAMIGQCYGKEYDYNNFDEESYYNYLNDIIEELEESNNGSI